jgi:hypothetical protein
MQARVPAGVAPLRPPYAIPLAVGWWFMRCNRDQGQPLLAEGTWCKTA